ncbi:hypothetical protein [Novosphingobium sp. B-7]|nr:hypothetical protein [Novosphingobium sp. B-7]
MKIARRCGLKKARVALARRLSVIMHAILRDGISFQPAGVESVRQR